MVKLLSLVIHHLLGETIIHPVDIIQHLYAHYGQAKYSLRKDQSHVGLRL